MEVKVFDAKGKATSKKVTLSDSVFGIEPNDHAIYLDVKQHLANRRQGTHKAKERAEIAGSTKKIKKQKGTCLISACVNLIYFLKYFLFSETLRCFFTSNLSKKIIFFPRKFIYKLKILHYS